MAKKQSGLLEFTVTSRDKTKVSGTEYANCSEKRFLTPLLFPVDLCSQTTCWRLSANWLFENQT